MILAKRAFHVILFEKRERLGGQMYLASLPPHRTKMGNYILYAEKQLKDLGVEIHLNEEATEDKIRAGCLTVVKPKYQSPHHYRRGLFFSS